MLKKIIFSILLILILQHGFSQGHRTKPVSVIFDSDIGPDYDDVGAITILHVLQDKGDAKILATVASNSYEGIAAILNIFNTYYHTPNIPIGVPTGAAVNLKDSQHWTDTLIAKYPHTIKRNSDVPDAVEVYRKILSEQPDNSVTVITVGFLTNIANLLNTSGDKYSPLTGKDLVKRKVKLLVSMAGGFPSFREYNIFNDTKSSITALENWPTPVIYSGFEIGSKIKTGLPLVLNTTITNDPAKDVFKICIPMSAQDSEGRMSWDETAVLVGVLGHEPYFNLHPGKIKINSEGKNDWDETAKGQYYLEQKGDPKKVQDLINDLMMQQPKN